MCRTGSAIDLIRLIRGYWGAGFHHATNLLSYTSFMSDLNLQSQTWMTVSNSWWHCGNTLPKLYLYVIHFQYIHVKMSTSAGVVPARKNRHLVRTLSGKAKHCLPGRHNEVGRIHSGGKENPASKSKNQPKIYPLLRFTETGWSPLFLQVGRH